MGVRQAACNLTDNHANRQGALQFREQADRNCFNVWQAVRLRGHHQAEGAAAQEEVQMVNKCPAIYIQGHPLAEGFRVQDLGFRGRIHRGSCRNSLRRVTNFRQQDLQTTRNQALSCR